MDWIAQFLAAHPKVRVDFILSDDRTDLIADGIDVAFRAGELKDSSLIARRLYASPLVLVASPAYVRERGMPCSLQDLATHDCITSGKPGRTLWHVNGEGGHESVAVRGRFGANTAKSQITAARAGLGICLAPESLVAPMLQEGTLVAVLRDVPQPKVDVFVVYPNRKHVPQAVTAFLEMALSQLAAAAWVRSDT